ncbi:MAG: helix-turn-helix transcriptional regulator [Sedimentisphaerales bacterium]|jgi:DNA-binding XRE family transcriptional regulator
MAENPAWKWEDDEQKRKMEEEVTQENCGDKLLLIREVSGLSRRDIAQILGVRESTIYRLERHITKPSKVFMDPLRALQVIGISRFKNMSEVEKKKAAEMVGVGTGIGAGIGASVATISAAGTVSGLSAAGITSGLAAIGGTMLGGIAVIATIPAAAGLLGYGIVKGIRKICEENELSCKEFDDRWEIRSKKATNT